MGVGGLPFAGYAKGGRFLFSYAEESQACDRARRSALHHVLLLPAACVAGNGASAKSGGADFGRGAGEVWIRAGGLRDHAGACAPADRGIAGSVSGESGAGVQAAGVAPNAGERERRGVTIGVPIQGRKGGVETVLAAAVLRLQCVHASEAEGEVGVYACKSGEGEAGGASAGLALEQLDVL